jgi:hypothetical protein
MTFECMHAVSGQPRSSASHTTAPHSMRGVLFYFMEIQIKIEFRIIFFAFSAAHACACLSQAYKTTAGGEMLPIPADAIDSNCHLQ